MMADHKLHADHTPVAVRLSEYQEFVKSPRYATKGQTGLGGLLLSSVVLQSLTIMTNDLEGGSAGT